MTTAPDGIDVDERMRRRRAVRQRIGERRLLEHKANDARRRLAALDREAEEAADAHAAKCRPLQQELAKLDREMAAALGEMRPIGADLERRRRQLLDQIDAATAALSDEVAKIERHRQAPREEIWALDHRVAELATLEDQLIRPPLCNMELHLEHYGYEHLLKWAGQFVGAAQEQADKARHLLDDARERRDLADIEVYERRHARAEAVLRVAGRAMGDAVMAREDLARRMRDE